MHTQYYVPCCLFKWLYNNVHCSLVVISNFISVSELVALRLGLAYTT